SSRQWTELFGVTLTSSEIFRRGRPASASVAEIRLFSSVEDTDSLGRLNFRHRVQNEKETLARMCDERAEMIEYQFKVSMNNMKTSLPLLIKIHQRGKNPSAIDQ
ncbi:hypothetical protein Tsubulata_009848, partial [Turnera subulata]